ncbi:MAG: hypothetical protein AB1486_34080 [Planctomycetota bacterium]
MDLKEVAVVSANPKAEAEALLNDLLPFAKRMLAAHGEFFPFGGYMRTDGSIVHVGAKDPTTDRPKSATLIETLTRDFRERARHREIRAAAVMFDVKVLPPGGSAKTDAIQVNLEHKDSYCAEVFFPYRLGDSGALEFGQTFAQEGRRVVFVK